MSNLLNIYNENFGQTVVTNGNFIAVSNVNSKPYDCDEGFSRISEVLVYQKNQFTTNYSLAKVYKRPASIHNGEILSYYTEQSASALHTASISKESGSATNNDLSCSFVIVEDDSINILQSNFGAAMSICEKFLVISDPSLIETLGDAYINNSFVNVYKLYDDSVGYCGDATTPTSFTLPDAPYCKFTGSSADGFGTAVAVSDKYLAISSPYASNNSGSVYVYQASGSCETYYLMQVISSSNSSDKYFGSAVYIDKYSQDKLVISSAPETDSKVFVYTLNNNSWSLNQVLTQNTSSKWYKLDGTKDLDWYPDPTRTIPYNTGYGHSIAVANRNLIVGSPTDLIYYEYSSSLQLIGSQTLRYRGAIYHYCIPTGSVDSKFVLMDKSYGDVNTFKDNMLGHSVDITNKYAVAGSPKPNFPYSSLYLSGSVDRYDINFEPNDFGSSTFNGQVLLYHIVPDLCGDKSTLSMATTTPIGYRKKMGETFSAFGSAVGLSDINLVVGSPTSLNDDLYLNKPFALEQSSSGLFSCSLSNLTAGVYFRMEDAICDCSGHDLNSTPSGSIIYVMDDTENGGGYIFGKSFIYDFSDLHKNYTIGNSFYGYNKLVINNTGSILSDILKDPLNNLNGYIYGSYQSQITLHEKQYICTVEPGEFNVSTNPTALTSSFTGSYCVIDKDVFDFNNLDIILRYINYKLTSTHAESWWNVLVSGDVQESIFGFFTSSITNYTDNRLTTALKCELSTKNFDVNNDGIVNYADAYMIWNYFISNLTIENYQQYVTPTSKRKSYDDIIKFLDKQTGKGGQNIIKAEFFEYNHSSSIDPTGSYLAPYITDVGLYSGADLVAIAKLASPIKNNGQIPINIVVKWDT